MERIKSRVLVKANMHQQFGTLIHEEQLSRKVSHTSTLEIVFSHTLAFNRTHETFERPYAGQIIPGCYRYPILPPIRTVSSTFSFTFVQVFPNSSLLLAPLRITRRLHTLSSTINNTIVLRSFKLVKRFSNALRRGRDGEEEVGIRESLDCIAAFLLEAVRKDVR